MRSLVLTPKFERAFRKFVNYQDSAAFSGVTDRQFYDQGY
jgi:hypothetical protein